MEADLPSTTTRHDQREDVRLVKDVTYDDENHKSDIPPYGRHGLYQGRGNAVGTWKSRRLAQSFALRCCGGQNSTVFLIQEHTLQQTQSSLHTLYPQYVGEFFCKMSAFANVSLILIKRPPPPRRLVGRRADRVP